MEEATKEREIQEGRDRETERGSEWVRVEERGKKEERRPERCIEIDRERERGRDGWGGGGFGGWEVGVDKLH